MSSDNCCATSAVPKTRFRRESDPDRPNSEGDNRLDCRPVEELDELLACTDSTANATDNGDVDDDIPSEAVLVVPPDGGWGWMVVLGSFMCNVILDGIMYTFSQFLDAIAADLGVEDKTRVTLAGSLMSGFYLMAGPFASGVANRYGFRLVAVSGAALSALSLVAASYSTGLGFLCFSYGVLGGIGAGLIYVPSVIIIGFYFERWRALATGIAVCGSGIGTFAFAPLNDVLIEAWGWRNTLICHALMLFSCVLWGALFRPLKPKKVKDLTELDGKPKLTMDPSKLPAAARAKIEQATNAMRRNTISHDHQSSIPRFLGVNNNSDYPSISDVYHNHTIHVLDTRIRNRCREEKTTLSVPHLAEQLLLPKKPNPIVATRRNPVQNRPKDKDPEPNRPLYRDDIFFSASLTRLPQYAFKSSIAYNLAVTRLPTKKDIEEEEKSDCKVCPEAVKRVLATMLDFGLMKSPTFLVLAVGGFFIMMGFYVPLMYLSERAVRGNMDKGLAVWLVSSIGIANTVGRMLSGVLGSFPGVDALVLTNCALTLGGVATMFSGLSLTAEYQFFYAVVFGLTMSCFASLRSIVVVDLLGLEKLTNAFGLLLLFQGAAAIIGAPLAGQFMRLTDSYDASFYLSGSMFLAGAFLGYPLHRLNGWEKRRNGAGEVKAAA